MLFYGLEDIHTLFQVLKQNTQDKKHNAGLKDIIAVILGSKTKRKSFRNFKLGVTYVTTAKFICVQSIDEGCI